MPPSGGWVHLPPGTTIDVATTPRGSSPSARGSGRSSRFGGRKVETRMLWKATQRRVGRRQLRLERGADRRRAGARAGCQVSWRSQRDRRHSIPSRGDCVACHGSPARPLGFNALQLSHRSRSERAPRRAARTGDADARDARRRAARCRPPATTSSDAAADPQREPATRTALGYLAGNCGSCHRRGTRPSRRTCPRSAYADVTADGDAVAAALVLRAHALAGAGLGGRASVAVDPVVPERSALLARMRSRRPSSQMPPLGTVVRDEAAIDAITRWIETDLGGARNRTASWSTMRSPRPE